MKISESNSPISFDQMQNFNLVRPDAKFQRGLIFQLVQKEDIGDEYNNLLKETEVSSEPNVAQFCFRGLLHHQIITASGLPAKHKVIQLC